VAEVIEAACPVCDEPLTARAERCFRCETPLTAWWAFDAALAGIETPSIPAPVPRPPTRAWTAIAVLAFVLGGAMVAAIGGQRRAGEPVAPSNGPAIAPLVAAPIAEAPSRAAPAQVHYRVQCGDSLWRVAAALTGDGRRWTELWPQAGPGPLKVGVVLEVDASRLRGSDSR
jgi:hypothetical protein